MATSSENAAPALDVFESADYVNNTTDNAHTVTIKGNCDGYIWGKVTVGTASATIASGTANAPAVEVLSLNASGTDEDIVGRFPLKSGDTVVLTLDSGATGSLMLRLVDPRRGG